MPKPTRNIENRTPAKHRNLTNQTGSKMNSSPTSIAIIGLACRLPGDVNDLDTLWDFCSKARCATSTIAKGRFNASQHSHPVPPKEGHFYAEGGDCRHGMLTSAYSFTSGGREYQTGRMRNGYCRRFFSATLSSHDCISIVLFPTAGIAHHHEQCVLVIVQHSV